MANKSYAEQIKAIKQDVRKVYDGITRDLAREASNDLAKTSYNIIQNFYDSYNPEYYDRTYNLYNMVYKNNVYRYGIENSYIASVTTTSLLMNDVYGKTSKSNIKPDNIFDLMWNKGHRGLPFQNLEPKWYPQIYVNGYLYASESPNLLIKNYIKKWGDNIGKKKIDKIDKKYKSNKYISF